jgi:hypothetical protein
VNLNDVIPHAKGDIKIKYKIRPRIRQAHHSYWFLFRGKKVILVVRNLKDAMMSAYDKVIKINGNVVSFGDFIKGDYDSSGFDYTTASLERRVRFMNRWGDNINKAGRCHVIKYENLKSDTTSELAKIIRFAGCNVDDELIKETVLFCSKDNMSQLSDVTEGSHRHAVSKKNERNISKYFDEQTKKWFVNYMKNNLNNNFGYERERKHCNEESQFGNHIS